MQEQSYTRACRMSSYYKVRYLSREAKSKKKAAVRWFAMFAPRQTASSSGNIGLSISLARWTFAAASLPEYEPLRLYLGEAGI